MRRRPVTRRQTYVAGRTGSGLSRLITTIRRLARRKVSGGSLRIVCLMASTNCIIHCHADFRIGDKMCTEKKPVLLTVSTIVMGCEPGVEMRPIRR